MTSSRLFFEAERVNIEVKCPALDEHITEAIHCYNQAVKAYQKEGQVNFFISNNHNLKWQKIC